MAMVGGDGVPIKVVNIQAFKQTAGQLSTGGIHCTIPYSMLYLLNLLGNYQF
jgi:hypothetical protein